MIVLIGVDELRATLADESAPLAPPMSLTPSETISQRAPRLRQHVALEARERRWAEPAPQHGVAADAGVEHRDVRRARVVMQSPRDVVRPAIVLVRARAAAVGDRIAEDDDRRRAIRRRSPRAH